MDWDSDVPKTQNMGGLKLHLQADWTITIPVGMNSSAAHRATLRTIRSPPEFTNTGGYGKLRTAIGPVPLLELVRVYGV